MNTLQLILDNFFNRIDYQTTHNGAVVNDYIYWKEYEPTTIQGPTRPIMVSGGYLIVYRNNETLHTYEHPENIFKKI